MRPCPDVDHGPVALGAQTATAAAATERMIRLGSVSNLDLQHPAFDYHRNLPTPIFGSRSKNCGAVHLSVHIFMPRAFTTEASKPINDSCGSPATARSGARQPEPQACKTYTAPSAATQRHQRSIAYMSIF